MKSIPKSSPDKELVKVFEAAGVVDFLEYLQSGKTDHVDQFQGGRSQRGWGHGWHDVYFGYSHLGIDGAGGSAACRGIFFGCQAIRD